MRIRSDVELLGETKAVIIEHGSEQIVYNLGYYSKIRAGDINDTFRDINNYWEWREKMGDDETREVFALYKEAAESLNGTINQTYRFREVRDVVKKLMALHPVDLMCHWVKTHSDIRFPDTLATTLNDGHRVEQTYLEPEYHDLTALSVVLKVMLPIWGEYLGMRNAITDTFPEKRALGLVEQTILAESNAYQRLEEFVSATLEHKGIISGTSTLLQGIGTLDMPDWMFSQCIVDRLTQIRLSHKDDDQEKTGNVIANLFNYIDSRVKAVEERQGFRVRDKEIDRGGKNEEDNTSTAENHTLRANVSEVTEAIFDFFTEDDQSNALAIKPDIDLELVKRQINMNMARKTFNPKEFQMRMAGLVTKPVVTPRSYGYINREGTIKLMSIAQVVCHEWGFSTLAELIGANEARRRDPSLGDNKFGRVQTKDYQNSALEKLLPYRRTVKVNKQTNRTVVKNPAHIAIEAIMAACSGHCWTPMVVDEIHEESEMIRVEDSCYIVPYNLRQVLADFYIKLNSLERGQ